MKSILVVDDEEHIRLLFQDELTDEGYHVRTAASAREGWEKLKERMPDLVILDIRMPEQSGLEMLEELRQRYPHLPIIMCTALKALQDDYTIWESQVAAFVSKPVDLDDLIVKVQDAIGAPD